MTEQDRHDCLRRYASGVPGILHARDGTDDLLSRARGALVWAIEATDAEPRDGWVWSGYAEKRVNPNRVNDYLSAYRRAQGEDSRYLWTQVGIHLSSRTFLPGPWLALRHLEVLRPEWVVYQACFAGLDHQPEELRLLPVLQACGLWPAAAAVSESIWTQDDPYIEKFEEPFFTRRNAAALVRTLLSYPAA